MFWKKVISILTFSLQYHLGLNKNFIMKKKKELKNINRGSWYVRACIKVYMYKIFKDTQKFQDHRVLLIWNRSRTQACSDFTRFTL